MQEPLTRRETVLELLRLAFVIALLASLFLAQGCGTFCMYHGKAVSRRDAERMKALGMDVKCYEPIEDRRPSGGGTWEPKFDPAPDVQDKV